ncbi:OmpH family outer membrane protein [Candidatus Pelagibacter sp.]|nr:OmpH family outer membrane protein [Candidatus Pelagibacter sp.]
MKKLFLPFFFIIFFSNNAICAEKIAFIDMDRVISTSISGVAILEQLNKSNKENIIFFKKEEKMLEEKKTKLISQKNIISEADFQNKIKQFKVEINNYNKNKDKIIKDFNKLKVNSTNELLKLINPILIKYSDENFISVILQKKDLVIGKKELDITDEIIKIVNTQVKKFKIN